MQSDVFNCIKSYAIKKVIDRSKVKKLTDARDKMLKETVFKVLVCPEFYTNKEVVVLEPYEVKIL